MSILGNFKLPAEFENQWPPRRESFADLGSKTLTKIVCLSGLAIVFQISEHNWLRAELPTALAVVSKMSLLPSECALESEAVLSKAQAQADEYPLPNDPKAVVLSLDYGGGLPTPQQKDFKPTPYVRVQADGTVITGGSSPRAPVAEMKLTAAELQSLLQGIIAADKLFEIKPGEIDEAIKRTGERIMVADAPTTTLTVKLADKEVRLSQYASRMVKSQFPQVDSLQRFVRAENRLHKLYSVALLGGNESVREMLAEVNQAIGAKSAEWPTMDADCLQSAQREPSGKLFATWELTGTISGQAKRLSVWVEVDESGQKKIELGEPRDPRH